jgi:DNA-binding Lrp family transcriptional regulator
VRSRVQELLDKKMIQPPRFPFIGLYREYPLLVLTWADLPYDQAVETWLDEDPHVFAAFRSRFQEYNTLLVLYHKDITDYQLWREQLAAERKAFSANGSPAASSTSFFSNQLMVKFDPNAPIYLLEEEVRRDGRLSLNGCMLDKLDFQILKLLVTGRCIKLNENQLSRELGIHRKTIASRTEELLAEKWIGPPICRFPNFFIPPDYILAICRLQIKSAKQEFIQNIRNDPHITLALDIKEGVYDLLLFGAFKDLADELEWEVKTGLYLPNSIGKVDVQFFAPQSVVIANNRKVSLGLIDKKYPYFRL